MSRRSVIFHPNARDELREAVRYYEQARRGLGVEFAAEVQATIEQVTAQPLTGFPSEAGTRRRLLPRFPYSVIYLPEADRLRIVALMHHRRKPGYWLSRVSGA